MQNDVANIANLGYSYPPFSLASLQSKSRNSKRLLLTMRGIPTRDKSENCKRVLTLTGINITKFNGAFSIKAYATTASHQKFYLGMIYVFTIGVLSECDNCAVHQLIERRFSLKQIHVEEEKELIFRVKFKLQNGIVLQYKFPLKLGFSVVKKAFGIPIQFSY